MNKRTAKRRMCAAVAEALASKRAQLEGRTDADSRRAIEALDALEREMTRRGRKVASVPEVDPRQAVLPFDGEDSGVRKRPKFPPPRMPSYMARESTKACEWPRDVPPPPGGCLCFPCTARGALKRAPTPARRA